jgi:hypothetical protein
LEEKSHFWTSSPWRRRVLYLKDLKILRGTADTRELRLKRKSKEDRRKSQENARDSPVVRGIRSTCGLTRKYEISAWSKGVFFSSLGGGRVIKTDAIC